ncbi:MAG: serine/threonine-protein kinase [Candidatus Xenobia bacterium]
MKWFDAIQNALKGKKMDETRVMDGSGDTTQALDKTVAGDTLQVSKTKKSDVLKVGDDIAGYKLLRLLGAGGMGRVYLVAGADGTEYALKTIVPEPDDVASVQRFVREIEIGRLISHPNVCRLIASGIHGTMQYMVMEYLNGQMLSDCIGEKAPMPAEETTDLMRQLLGGLGAIHQAGAVHRDLKPGNIVLVENGRTLKIMDFGISRITSGPSMTRTGSALGTPNFIAPEQVLDSKRVDRRADLFCVGLIAYNMLSGHLPFEAPRVQLMLTRLVGNDYTPLQTYRTDLPEALVSWVHRLMAHDVEARYPTAEAALEAL